jgi:large subunit ribosomal protein L19e
MSVATVKRLAADILDVGQNRIRMNPEEMQRVKEALTRGDVDALIKEKVITLSEQRGRKKLVKKNKGKRTRGKRKGVSRKNSKEEWMKRVRSQRKYLKQLLAENKMDKEHKRAIYMKIKSGVFKNKGTMLNYLKENKIFKGETQ